jgi:predicted pyridoxine 5'-phosphate oxidase superfamily flavin-nucleotide-binding protein
MSEHSVFHRGERVIQERAGDTALADRNAVVLTDAVISGARPFIGKQSMVVLASIDAQGGVWASIMFGKPGFVHTDSGKSILLDVPAQERDDTDPFWRNIDVNASMGSRRRYRVNGSLIGKQASGIEVGVIEAYPNCPKYIQRRNLRDLGSASLPVTMVQGTHIDDELASIVRQADTLFVASNHPKFGADVSHRGGAPGYISILNDEVLRIPDYPGNCLYNTFGNFEVNPHAGLCIPDFPGNRVLQLSGEATLRWDVPDPQGHTGGTQRFWDFKIDRWYLRDTPQRLEWEYLDASPFNLPVAAH